MRSSTGGNTACRARTSQRARHCILHLAENGSPSGPPRDEAQQVASITTRIRTLHARAACANLTHDELFNLRDADSCSDQAVGSLGLVTSCYRPKQRCQTDRDLVQELSA